MHEKFAEANQAHVLDHFESLTEEQQTLLLNDLSQFDPSSMNQLFQDLVESAQLAEDPSQAGLEKMEDDFIADTQKMSEEEKSEYENRGLEIIRKGKAACVILAGGSGSRLGFEHPKGMFDIDLPSGKSIFQVLTERFLRV